MMIEIRPASFVLLLVCLCFSASNLFADTRPNVLFIAVDDMNDWITPLGSNRAKTPHLQRLADMGVTFTNAHCPGVFCAPSRTAIFTGRYPSTTGHYMTTHYMDTHPEIRPLQVLFKEGGYKTMGMGKLFHHGRLSTDLRGWDLFNTRNEAQREMGYLPDSWGEGTPRPDPYPASTYNQKNPKWKGKPFMEVGAIKNEEEAAMADTIRADWASEMLSQKHDKPLFLAVGFYAPHYPNYVPQKYLDMYPVESIERAPYRADDLDDLPKHVAERFLARKKDIFDRLESWGEVELMIRGYLASITYADAMLGRMLDALEKGPHKDNTIIVFWSDHGYALGEKGHWGKHTLWQRTTNVPFLWAGPGIARGVTTNATASLVDIYPTLAEMCGLKPDAGAEGISLKEVLQQGLQDSGRSIWTIYSKPNSYSVINRDWRYIHHSNETEELYNTSDDPHEWKNLAENPEYASIKEQLINAAPTQFAPSIQWPKKKP
ncbi:MAG: sulfatase [Verrucomicrobiota bacterium]